VTKILKYGRGSLVEFSRDVRTISGVISMLLGIVLLLIREGVIEID